MAEGIKICIEAVYAIFVCVEGLVMTTAKLCEMYFNFESCVSLLLFWGLRGY